MVHRERYHTPGFTFMELVVAILILGLLAGVGVPLYMRFVEQARERTTQSNLGLLKNTITQFNIELGKYPSRLEELVDRPKGEIGKKWKQYLEKLPKDGWGNDFYYKVTQGGKKPYQLYSYGSGGPEGESQISVWDL